LTNQISPANSPNAQVDFKTLYSNFGTMNETQKLILVDWVIAKALTGQD